MLNKASGIPLHIQLANLLREQAYRKELRPNDRLPSEREMCEMHGISRITVRQAIPGHGPGEGAGMGGGRGGGIGSGVGPYVAGVGGVRPPVVIFQPLPAYTEEARKSRTEGIVLIQAVIRRDGTVDSFKVIRGLGFGLDESAINTIATKWRFKPGTLDGRPVDVQANIEVTFRLY